MVYKCDSQRRDQATENMQKIGLTPHITKYTGDIIQQHIDTQSV